MISLSAPAASIGKRTAPPADGQARNALWRPRGKEERRGRADIRADDMRSSEAPLVDQAGQERSRGVRSDQFRATVGVTESRHVDGDNPPDCRDAVPDSTEGPKGFGPRRQQQHGDVRVCLGIGEPHSHSVADSEVGSDRRTRLCAHLTVSSFSPNRLSRQSTLAWSRCDHPAALASAWNRRMSSRLLETSAGGRPRFQCRR